ncbi:MAG: ribosomal protein S18-alanine N-acetyltransferase [Acidobacteriota bacterium]
MMLADVAAVHAIEVRSYPNPWPARSFEYEVTSSPASRLWVVEESDGTIIAYLATWLIPPELHINNLAVIPGHRRRGLGSALLRFALQFGIASGAGMATLEVRGANDAARSLYRKHGFVETGLRAGFYDSPRDDAIIMSREIGPSGTIE